MEKSNLPRVTEILRAEGLIDFSKVPQDIMERAQLFGTAVHSTTELWDKGTLNLMKLDPLLIPYLEGWKKFIKDYGISFKPDEIERQLISIKWGFKGTPDRWPIVQGKRTLIDLKSSTAMYPSTSIQTAAYQILLEENGIKVQQRWGIQLNDKGIYKIIPYTKLSDRTVFLSALNLWKWKKENL
ncbi:MAG: hypothetical protein WC738_04190 [Candidatus Omnitrophota bacterium]